MSRMARAFALAGVLAAVLVVWTASDAHAAKREKKSDNGNAQQGTIQEKNPWWKFWDRKKEVEPEPLWHGFTRNRSQSNAKTQQPFTVKVRKHAKPGEDPREARLNPKKKKKANNQGNANAGAESKKTPKRYQKQNFSHKSGNFRTEQLKKQSGQKMRLDYMLKPQKKPKTKTYSHKNGHFRDKQN